MLFSLKSTIIQCTGPLEASCAEISLGLPSLHLSPDTSRNLVPAFSFLCMLVYPKEKLRLLSVASCQGAVHGTLSRLIMTAAASQ